MEKLDSVKEKLVSKLKNKKVISKGKAKGGVGKTLAFKNSKLAKLKGKGFKKLAGKKLGGKRKRPDCDALDKDLDKYWIKKGETGTVQSHLDNEMDDYWKNAGKD